MVRFKKDRNCGWQYHFDMYHRYTANHLSLQSTKTSPTQNVVQIYHFVSTTEILLLETTS